MIRFKRAEADSFNTLNRAGKLNRVAEFFVKILSVGRQVDADKNNFFVAGCGKLFKLGFQRAERL